MKKKELKELCEFWSEFLQQYSHEKYFIGDNGKLMFQSDDLELMESSEGLLVSDINESFEEYIVNANLHRLFIDFIEKVLLLDYGKPQWQMTLNLLNAMPKEECRNYVMGAIREQCDTPQEKAYWLMFS